MVIDTQRIKVPKSNLKNILEDTKAKFGSCCQSTIYDALTFKTLSTGRAMYIRDLALNKYCGVLVQDKKFV